LDLERVTSIDIAAANLLREVYERLIESGRTVSPTSPIRALWRM
jgi:hypothetical protein